jgi:hypothetical protein
LFVEPGKMRDSGRRFPMDARALPRQVIEWIFRPAALREARSGLRRGDDPREVAARQARLLLEVARRTAEPAESLPPGGKPAVMVGLYRDAIYWGLAARRAGPTPPPTDLRELWDASNAQLSAATPPDNEESVALRRTLFDDHAARSLAITDQDAARARAFAEALVWELDAARRRVERVFVQRWLRVALIAAAALGLLIASRALWLGPNLAAGRPFRVSSTSSGWPACLANNGCKGLMFHTETEDNPWVEIDLGAPRKVRRVEVINRADCCADRAKPLVAEVSIDRVTWTQVARNDEEFGSWKLDFSPRLARYVRLRSPRHTVLHLQAIAVR